MQDRITLGISDTFREYIESLVEEVVLNGEPFDAQKKWLRKHSEVEGLNYEIVESNLNDFFEAIKELEENESRVIERSVRASAKDCYLDDATVNKLIDYAAVVRTQKAERKAREEWELKTKEESQWRDKYEGALKAKKDSELKVAQWQQKYEAARKAKEDAERIALSEKRNLEEANKKAEEESQWRVKYEGALKAKNDSELKVAQWQQKYEAARKAKEDAERKALSEKRNLEEANKKAKAGIEQKANKDIERKAQQANTVSLLNELSAQLQILSDNLNKQKANVNNTVPAGWSSVFCEQLRLAYCNKDIAFLEKSYTPNAQVTTGAFDTKTNQIRYRAQGYQQYMANLRYIFSKNKAINVRFETDSLTGVLYVSADGRWQLVRLLQQWQSDRYSDRGYLLLLLCIDQTGPKVHIRVWQPEYLGNRHITAQELYGVHNIQGLP